MFIGSNASSAELLKYTQVPPELESVYSNLLDELEFLKKELKLEREGSELAWEQVHNAKDLVSSIQEGLKHCTSAKQARDSFKLCLENGHFEM